MSAPHAGRRRVRVCRKCEAQSGDDYSQCSGACPIPDSPHFSEETRAQHGGSFKFVEEQD